MNFNKISDFNCNLKSGYFDEIRPENPLTNDLVF